jgi:starch phosphorylase
MSDYQSPRFVLPDELHGLKDLAFNLWWSWNPEAQDLFAAIDPSHGSVRNPVRLLRQTPVERLEELTRDPSFMAKYHEVMERLQSYLHDDNTWFRRTYPSFSDGPVAYFSAEFAFHECLPIYSGGLGVLAGDHCKSASDLGVPFVGVGLLYRNGYFRQEIDPAGNQNVIYPNHPFEEMPLQVVKDASGQDLTISVELPYRRLYARLWRVDVGRVSIYLLDSDIPENSPADRAITSQLYSAGRDLRISQEILLGIGGVRALEVLGVEPSVWHMNEGHVAFLGLERIRRYMERYQLDFDDAVEAVAASTVFTTHTPVPAGNETFTLPRMHKYFRDYCESAGIPLASLLSLGAQSTSRGRKVFSMTVLAIRLSGLTNGVSALHGQVARKMWQHLWPGVTEPEVPITSITNGVHTHTWIAREFGALYDKYLNGRWQDHLTDDQYWKHVLEIPDEVLWQTHQNLKNRLIEFVRDRLRRRLNRLGAGEDELGAASNILNPDALTIGFARRFAPYKRADLIFSDIERARRLFGDPDRPVQIIFAGKAHPADEQGQALIRRINEICQWDGFRGRVIFLEDYDMKVARYLVQGVDLWLNNPRRPLEASGTSGQKVPINGGINCSILDGWWAEGYDGHNGWAIGNGEEFSTVEEQDAADAAALYDVLENQVIPLYYDRDENGLPTGWIQKMKASISTIAPTFNTETMVSRYVEQMYIPMARRGMRFVADRFASASALAAWKRLIRQSWPFVHFTDVAVHNGEAIEVTARIYLGAVDPASVRVELLCEPDSVNGVLPHTVPMESHGLDAEGIYRYHIRYRPETGDSWRYRLRVIPSHPMLSHKHELGLIHWYDCDKLE